MDLGEVAFRISVLGEQEARQAVEQHIRDQDRVVQAMDDSARAAMRAAEIRERAIQRELRAYDDQVRAAMQIKRAYEDLAASFDPLNRAQLKYQRGLELLDRALAEQIINEKQYQAVLKGLEQQMQATVAAEKLRESQIIANEEKRTAAALEATTRAYERLLSSLDPVSAAEARYAEAQKVARAALEAKTISLEEHNRVMAMADLRRATDLTEAQTRADREAARATREVATEKSRLEAELNTFVATVSQTERAQQMYTRAQDLTTRAVEKGIITQDRANEVMAETQFRIQSMGHYVNDMGQVMSRSDSAWNRWARGGIQQAGYQVSDFFIQMQMGTPIMTALGQQGSQLLGSFGQWGAVLGGLLAISAAVYTIWSQMSGAAETLEDRLDSVGKSAQSVSDSLSKIEDIKFDGMFDGVAVQAEAVRTQFQMLLDMMEKVERKSIQMELDALRTGTGLEGYIRSFATRNSILQQTGAGAAQFDFMGLESEFQGRFVNRTLGEIGGNDREEILRSVEAVREKLELTGMLTDEVEQYLAVVTEELGLLDMLNEKQTESNSKQIEYKDLVAQTRSTMAELRREREAEAQVDESEKYARAMMIVQQYNQERIAGEKRVAEESNAIHAGMMAVQEGQARAQAQREEENASRSSRFYQSYYASRLDGENMLADAIQRYHDGLIAVQEAHETIARNKREFIELLEEMNIQGRNFAGLDFASPIAGGSREALVLATNLGIALDVAQKLADLGPQGIPTDPSGKTYSGRGSVNPDVADIFSMGNGYITPPKPGKKSGGGGGSKEQEDALQKLREQIALESELLGKTEAYGRVIKAIGDDRNKYSEAEIQNVVREIQALELKKKAMDQVASITQTMQSSFEEGFMSIMSGTKSVEDAFKDMAYNIIQELYRVLVVQQIVGSWNAQTGTGTGIVGWIGKLLGGFANGGVFAGGAQVRAFADGGVVSGPTMFPMRGGVGLMGEAGPEAIMPLSKGADGRLGVQVVGSASQEGDVHVHNTFNLSGSDATTVRQEVTKMLPMITQAAVAGVVRARQRGGQMRETFRS